MVPGEAGRKSASEPKEMTDRVDFYTVLGVARSASAEELKKAYKKQAMIYHPDRHSNASGRPSGNRPPLCPTIANRELRTLARPDLISAIHHRCRGGAQEGRRALQARDGGERCLTGGGQGSTSVWVGLGKAVEKPVCMLSCRTP